MNWWTTHKLMGENGVYKATHHYSGPVSFMLTGSGHIAGVVNPPAANKYYHYTNTEVPGDVEGWIEDAPGSYVKQ